MNFLEGIKLGFIQGATEFLPVSSSGHLALLSSGGIDLFTEVLLHAATLLSVLAVLYKEFAEIFFSPFKCTKLYKTHGAGFVFKDKNTRLLLFIIVGSIPAAIVGLFIEKHMDHLLKNKTIVAMALAMTGFILLGTRFFPKKKKKREINLLDSIIIGAGQALAIIPGLSRSGLTISSALYRGVKREQAGVFSFLLSIPVIAGATLLQLLKLGKTTSPQLLGNSDFLMFFRTTTFQPLFHITGFITSFLCGYIALRVLIKLIKNGKFHFFAWYCFAAAIASLILS